MEFVAVYLPRALIAGVRRIAAEEGRTQSDLLRHIITLGYEAFSARRVEPAGQPADATQPDVPA